MRGDTNKEVEKTASLEIRSSKSPANTSNSLKQKKKTLVTVVEQCSTEMLTGPDFLKYLIQAYYSIQNSLP